jgi:Pvc16 N-terminal domain
MISDLSETLRAILTQPGLPAALAAAQIAFDRPTEPFNPTQTTLDLFLYEIRENHELRADPRVPSPGGGSAETAPMSLACSYLVTAWPVGGPELALQEHNLLGETLQVLAGYPVIPAALLQGSLAAQRPLPQMLVLHPDAIKNTSEFWTALGSKLRPSLSVTVTIAVNPFQATP